MTRVLAMSVMLTIGTYAAVAGNSVRVPRIWDDAALAEWATPVAGLNVRPAHYSSAEYYAAPVDNLRTYPVYRPDREPPGYWEWLQKQKPEPLVDANRIRTKRDWIASGERAFRDMDLVLSRTNDPALIARARDRQAFQSLPIAADGSIRPARWVVTPQGVMLTTPACSSCHGRTGVIGDATRRPPDAARPPDERPRRGLPLTGAGGTARRLLLFYAGDSLPTALWKEFTVPWAPDERVERFRTMSLDDFQMQRTTQGLDRSFENGMFARANGSPYYATKIPDLHDLQYNRYLDATATHRLRGPEDIARYAALVTGADRMDYGPHRILTDAQRRVRHRYADESLYAIGMYLMSLEPPKNPNRAPDDIVMRGERVFRAERCDSCHAPPTYTNGRLIAVAGFDPPPDHPNRADIMDRSVGTDPGVALKTRKGTGLYKVPSLRGVWYRRLLLHDGSLTSLEELLDPARLDAEYAPKGWNPPGVMKRAVPGHRFGVTLSADEKHVLLAFLRSL